MVLAVVELVRLAGCGIGGGSFDRLWWWSWFVWRAVVLAVVELVRLAAVVLAVVRLAGCGGGVASFGRQWYWRWWSWFVWPAFNYLKYSYLFLFLFIP